MTRIDEQACLVERDCAVGDYIALLNQAVIAAASNPTELHEQLAQTPGLGIEQVVVARIESLPSPEAGSAVRREYEALVREIIELEQQFPPPNYDEYIADAKWFQAHQNTPEFEPYRGTHVAVLNGAVVGHGRDSDQLQLDMARKHNVHPQRLVLEYIRPRL